MSEEIAAPETGAETTAVVEAAETPVVEVEASPETPAEQSTEQANPGKERLQLRFSELTAQRRAAEERAEREAAEKEYWRQQALQRQQPNDDPAHDEYDPYNPQAIEAVVHRALTRREQEAAQQQAQAEAAQRSKSLQAKLFESGLEGAVLIASGAEIPFTSAMIDALAVSEQPAQVADHLGRNPAEAARIAGLPPQLQGYELAKLESRLASQPRTTNALPPPATVGARAAASADPASLNMEQYIAARQAGRI